MKTVLMGYASRYGGSYHLAQRIAGMLREQDVIVDMIDLRTIPANAWPEFEKYDGVIVGTGIKLGKWCSEAEEAIDMLQDEDITYGVFVTCYDAFKLGEQPAAEKYVVPKLLDAENQPVASAAFGPVFDLTGSHKVGFIERKVIGSLLKGVRKEGLEVPEGEITAIVDDSSVDTFVTDFLGAL